MERSGARSSLTAWGRIALRWILATVAPWGLAGGVLISFTAVASNDPQAGFSAAPTYGGDRVLAAALVPGTAATRLAAARPGGPSLPDLALGEILASPSAALGREVAATPSTPPRGDLKIGAGRLPRLERGGKSGPIGRFATSLSRRGLDLSVPTTTGAARLVFVRDKDVLPPTVLMAGPVAGPDWEAVRGLEPWSGEDPTATKGASSIQSPAAAAAGSTGAGRGPSRMSADGATPSVARAAALSSTTPAPAEAVPTEIAAAPVSGGATGGSSAVARSEAGDRPNYADLIAPGTQEREQRCLAEAVYFEARSEPEDGQAAVAQVVLNRVRSGLYPPSVCGVVYQNRHRHLACQFTFACEGKALRVTDTESWDTARRIAADVMQGRTYLAEVGGATHYHADYVRPSWARRLKKMDVIGRHIFYELRPGQT